MNVLEAVELLLLMVVVVMWVGGMVLLLLVVVGVLGPASKHEVWFVCSILSGY